MESELPQSEILQSFTYFQTFSGELVIIILIIFLLLIFLSVMAAFEAAFFSLDAELIKKIKVKNPDKGKILQKMRENPGPLPASILISTTITKAGLVATTYFFLGKLVHFDALAGQLILEDNLQLFSRVQDNYVAVSLQVILTLLIAGTLLLLITESFAKQYGSVKNVKITGQLLYFVNGVNSLFKPFSSSIEKWLEKAEKKADHLKSVYGTVHKDELDKAIEMSVTESTRADEELDILKSILTFNDVSVKQIMKPRMDVVALDQDADFEEVLSAVRESGFSRIPVYREDFDNVIGILYVKDLLSFLEKPKDFNWHKILRKTVLFVPESKKIKDLLKEFQSKRMHMAVVVDEYGGSAGIVTMEDILEEIFGDIRDEFDEIDEVNAEIIDENTYIFEGKTLINDVCRIIGEDIVIFDEIKGESDSIAGMLLEITGDIPEEGQEINFRQFTFTALSVTDRRVEKVRLHREVVKSSEK